MIELEELEKLEIPKQYLIEPPPYPENFIDALRFEHALGYFDDPMGDER